MKGNDDNDELHAGPSADFNTVDGGNGYDACYVHGSDFAVNCEDFR